MMMILGARVLQGNIRARKFHRATGADAGPRPGQTDHENGPKAAARTYRLAGRTPPNLDPDRVPSARMLGSELRENQSEQMPNSAGK